MISSVSADIAAAERSISDDTFIDGINCWCIIGTLASMSSEWELDFDGRRLSGDQRYITATELLERVRDHRETTPKELAKSRRRENVIRIQCRRLCEANLLRQTGHEAYALTSLGSEFLDEDSTATVSIENRTQTPYLDREWTITDFDELDAPVIKVLNEEQFFDDSANDYGWINDDPGLTRQRIRNVKSSKINRLIQEFPRDEPVPQQCAHWVRAFVGIHFFPDANHRTAMATLNFLLDNNEIHYRDFPGREIERAVLASKLIRIMLVDVKFNTLWEKDELYVHWHRYFQNLLCDVDDSLVTDYPLEQFTKVLEYARSIQLENTLKLPDDT